MLEHGLVDAIVPRKQLRERLGTLLAYMMPQE
jgi:acetyl-CoA carboxylase beta subunit